MADIRSASRNQIQNRVLLRRHYHQEIQDMLERCIRATLQAYAGGAEIPTMPGPALRRSCVAAFERTRAYVRRDSNSAEFRREWRAGCQAGASDNERIAKQEQ